MAGNFDPILGNLRQLTGTEDLVIAPAPTFGEAAGGVMEKLGELAKAPFISPQISPPGTYTPPPPAPTRKPSDVLFGAMEPEADPRMDWMGDIQASAIAKETEDAAMFADPAFKEVYQEALRSAWRGDILPSETIPLAKSLHEQRQHVPGLPGQGIMDIEEKFDREIEWAKEAKYSEETPAEELSEERLDWMEEQISAPVRRHVWGEEGYSRPEEIRQTRIENRRKIQRAFSMIVNPKSRAALTGEKPEEILRADNPELDSLMYDGLRAEQFIQEISDPKFYLDPSGFFGLGLHDPRTVFRGSDPEEGKKWLARIDARNNMIEQAKELIIDHYGVEMRQFLGTEVGKIAEESVVIEKLKEIQGKGVDASSEMAGRQLLLHDLSEGGIAKIIGEKRKPFDFGKVMWMPSETVLALMWGKRNLPNFIGSAEQLEQIKKSAWWDGTQTMYNKYYSHLQDGGSVEGIQAGRSAIFRAMVRLYEMKETDSANEGFGTLFMATDFVPRESHDGYTYALPDGTFQIPVDAVDWFTSRQEMIKNMRANSATNPDFRTHMTALGVYMAEGFQEDARKHFEPGAFDAFRPDHPLFEKFPEIKLWNDGRSWEFEMSQLARAIVIPGEMLERMTLRKDFKGFWNDQMTMTYSNSLLMNRGFHDGNPNSYLNIPAHRFLEGQIRRLDSIAHKHGPLSAQLIRLQAAQLARHDLDWSETAHLWATRAGASTWMIAFGLMKVGKEIVENATAAAVAPTMIATGHLMQKGADIVDNETLYDWGGRAKLTGVEIGEEFIEEMKFAGKSSLVMGEHYLRLFDDAQYREDYIHFRPIEAALDVLGAAEMALAAPRMVIKAAAFAPKMAGKTVRVFEGIGGMPGRVRARFEAIERIPGAEPVGARFDMRGPRIIEIKPAKPRVVEPPPRPVPKGAVKEPWEMTLNEFRSSSLWKFDKNKNKRLSRAQHKKHVERALDEGKDVPRSVSDDYKELEAKVGRPSAKGVSPMEMTREEWVRRSLLKEYESELSLNRMLRDHEADFGRAKTFERWKKLDDIDPDLRPSMEYGDKLDDVRGRAGAEWDAEFSRFEKGRVVSVREPIPPPKLPKALFSMSDRIELAAKAWEARSLRSKWVPEPGAFKRAYKRWTDKAQNYAASGGPLGRVMASVFLDRAEKLGTRMEVVIQTARGEVNTTLYVPHENLMEVLAKTLILQQSESIGSIAQFIQDVVEVAGPEFGKQKGFFGNLESMPFKTKLENPAAALGSIYDHVPGAKIIKSDAADAYAVKIDGKFLTFEDIANDIHALLDEATVEILSNKKMRHALLHPEELKRQARDPKTGELMFEEGIIDPATGELIEGPPIMEPRPATVGKLESQIKKFRKRIGDNPRLKHLLDDEKAIEALVEGKAQAVMKEMWDNIYKAQQKTTAVGDRVDDFIVRVPHKGELLNVRLADFEAAFMSDKSAARAYEFLASYAMDSTLTDLPTWTVKAQKRKLGWTTEERWLYEEKGITPTHQVEVSAQDLGFAVQDGDFWKPSPVVEGMLYERGTRMAMEVEHLSPQMLQGRMDLLRAGLMLSGENMYGVFALREGVVLPTLGKIPPADVSELGKAATPREVTGAAMDRLKRASRTYDTEDTAKLYQREMGMRPGAVFTGGKETANWIARILGAGGKEGKVVRRVGQIRDNWIVGKKARDAADYPMFASHDVGNGEFALKHVGGSRDGKFVTSSDVSRALSNELTYVSTTRGDALLDSVSGIVQLLKEEVSLARAKKQKLTKGQGSLRFQENLREALFERMKLVLHERGMPMAVLNKIKLTPKKKLTLAVMKDAEKMREFLDAGNVQIKFAEDYSAFDMRETFFGKHLFDAAEDGSAIQAMTAADNVLLGGRSATKKAGIDGLLKRIDDAYKSSSWTRKDALDRRTLSVAQAKKNPSSAIVAGVLSMDVHATMALWQYLRTGEIPHIMRSVHGKVLMEQWNNAGFWAGDLEKGRLTSLGISAGFVRAELGERFYRTAVTRAIMAASKTFSGPGSNFYDVTKMLPRHLQGVGLALDSSINDLMGKIARDVAVHFNSGLYSGNVARAGNMLRYFHDSYKDIFDKMVANLDPLSGDNMTAIKSTTKMKEFEESVRTLSESPHLQDNYFFAAQVTWAQLKHRIERLNIIHKLWEEGHILPGIRHDVKGKLPHYSAPGPEFDWVPMNAENIGVKTDKALAKIDNLALGDIWGKAAVTGTGQPKVYIRRYAAETLKYGDHNFNNIKKIFEGEKGIMSSIGHSIATAIEGVGKAGTKWNSYNFVQFWKTQKLMRAGIAPIVRNLFTNIVILTREYPNLGINPGSREFRQFWQDMMDYSTHVRAGIFKAETATMTDFNRWFQAQGIGGHSQTSDFINIGRTPLPPEMEANWRRITANAHREHAQSVRGLGVVEREKPLVERAAAEIEPVDVAAREKRSIQDRRDLAVLRESTDLTKGFIDVTMARFGKTWAMLGLDTPARASLSFLHDVFNYVFGFSPTNLPGVRAKGVGGAPAYSAPYDRFTRVTADLFSLVDEAPKYALAKHLWETRGPGAAIREGKFRLGKYGDGSWDAWTTAPEAWRDAEFAAYQKSEYMTPLEIRQTVGDLLTDYTKASPLLKGARGFVNPFMFFTAKVTAGLAKWYAKNPMLARGSHAVSEYLYAMQFDTPEELTALQGVSPDNASMLLSFPGFLFDLSYLNLMMNPGQLMHVSEWWTASGMRDLLSLTSLDRSYMGTTMDEDVSLFSILGAEKIGDIAFGSNQINWAKLGAMRAKSLLMSRPSEDWWEAVKQKIATFEEVPQELKESAMPNLRYAIDSINSEPYRRKETLSINPVTKPDALMRVIFGLRLLKEEPMYRLAQMQRAESELRKSGRKIKSHGKKSRAQEIADAMAGVKQTVPEMWRESRARDVYQKLLEERELAVPRSEAERLAKSGYYSLMSMIPKALMADPKAREWIRRLDPKVRADLMRDILTRKGASPSEVNRMLQLNIAPQYLTKERRPAPEVLQEIYEDRTPESAREPPKFVPGPAQEKGIDVMRRLNELGRGKF